MTYQPVVYLDPSHPDAFVDFPMRQPEHGYVHLCKQCHGHGGWNLQLNAYPLHAYADTAENRHRYSHFKASCSQCNGWGYTATVEDCIHTFDRELSVSEAKERGVPHFGHCYHVRECTKCGKIAAYDSSD